MGKRGQTAVEMIVILSIVLIILLVLIKLNNKTIIYSNRLADEAKANALLSDIEKTAEDAYKQGVGSRSKIYVNFPDNLKSVNITGKSIKITFNQGTTFFKNFNFNLSGNISKIKGSQNLIIESNLNNVNIKNE